MGVPFGRVALALCLVAGSARADPLVVEVVDWGVINPEVVKEAPAVDTATGHVFIISHRQLLRTDTIKACPGMNFGLRYVAKSGLTPGPGGVTVELRHPPFAFPGGNGRTLDSWRAYIAGVPLDVGWLFERDREIVPGRWTFRLLADGKEIGAKSFQVEKAAYCRSLESRSGAPPASLL
jgi:hypothetical protein